MHKWTTIQIAFVECDSVTQTAFVECGAVTSGLKCSDVTDEHGASIFKIPSGGHNSTSVRNSSRLHDVTLRTMVHDKYPKLAVYRTVSARTEQDTRFSHGGRLWWLPGSTCHDRQTDVTEGRSASETSETISQSTEDNTKEDQNP